MSEEGSTERLSVGEAAERLGVSRDAIYKRVRRGNLQHEQGEDDRLYVYVYLHRQSTESSTDASTEESSPHLERLLTAQERELEYLRGQLEAEREARRRADHIIAALTERIPELEAPPQSAQEAESVAEQSSRGEGREEAAEDFTEPQSEASERSETRPWWRRIFGG